MLKLQRCRVWIFPAAAILVLLTLTAAEGPQTGGQRMSGTMEHMDKMMGQGSQMMGQMDKMMQRTCPNAAGMMNMKGMMMCMDDASRSVKGMMGELNAIMSDSAMMNDPALKEQSRQMQENLRQMTDAMQKALDNMKKMTDRMGELNKK